MKQAQVRRAVLHKGIAKALHAGVFATALCFSVPGVAWAQSSAPAQFDIPAQPLSAALKTFADQAGMQLLYRAEAVDRVMARPVQGRLDKRQALQQLLQGTNLEVIYSADDAATIRPRSSGPSGRGEKKTIDGAADAVAEPDAAGADRPARAQQAATDFDAVQVTGSRLSRTEVEGPQPLLVFKREQIERSGQSSVVDFLRTLPEASGSGINVESSFGGNPHAQTVQLRGLPTGRTLVLLNGRRMPNSASVDGGFANLNNIPIGAVERIDVLPQGASAIYGSDALAGVINIILKRDVDGAHVSTRFGSADGTSDRRASIVWGHASDRGSITLNADYYDRTALMADERERLDDVDFTREGWRNLTGTACGPGNVYSTNGGTLPGLNAPSGGVPGGLTGTATIADFAGTEGRLNRCYVGGSTLLFPASRLGLMGAADWRLGERTTLFAEASYNKAHHEYFYPFTLSKVLVPAANPFNPFGQDVLVDYRFSDESLGYATSAIDSRMTRVLLGARGDLGGDWQWEVTGWNSREHMWSIYRIPNPGFASQWLSSIDPQTALNLFTSGMPASQDILDAYAASPGAYALSQNDAERDAVTSTKGANFLFRGSLATLPAGPLSLAIGGERLRESFENTGSNRGDFGVSRDSDAIYAELRAPVLSRGNGDDEKSELLTLSGALRRDDYSDFGSATAPQFGIEWRPSKGFLVRAAYAEAFRAPDLYSVYGPSSRGVWSGSVLDPRRNNERAGDTYLSGGNPDLKPETGKSLSAGLVWSSTRWEGLNASINWWRIEMTDRISNFPSLQLIVDNEDLFPDRVIREAPQGDGLPGRITEIDYSALNLGDIWVEGVDLGIDYRFRTAQGNWFASLRTTRYTRYDALLNPQVGTNDYLAKANTDIWVPRWRGTLALNWSLDSWSASMTGRYVGRYRDYNPLTNGVYRQLGNFWTMDADVRWAVGQDLAAGSRWFSKTFVSLGAVNLLDREPEFSATTTSGYGWDGSQNDIRGRYAYLEIGLNF
ncbi:hypothetical protein CSC74_09240 [Pseudoxanthomonas yeongjuensis]|uniref:TonB-dependent receptor n=1 Tax=Pseudoxanthomonas yeongjuensis TaxID=377616 RepID=UPI001391EAB1|nr:TonB-dependent receptor [Pseudoxanthomonas yeongjuensis]KAF1717034.1 hypothetical protein CSC74_09240 [Pseudoxanthomonas yeongjuensis]